MSLIQKKDVDLLLHAGFSMEDLGLSDGGKLGVEIYETPADYFAHELIENACEDGTVDLMDEPSISEEEWTKVRYDNTRKGIYEDNIYDGNDDLDADIPQGLREQAEFLKTIEITKMGIWQRKNKNGQYEWPVKSLKISIPEEDKLRYSKMSPEYQKEFWINCAKEEWKKCWRTAVESLHSFPIEEKIEFKTHKGYPLNLLIINADNLRNEGYKNLPAEARWVSLIYWVKDKRN